jgi:hypothetical protein
LEQLYSPQLKVEDVAAAWSKERASHITDNTINPLHQKLNDDSKLNSTKWQEQLENIAKEAYIWSHKVNTSFFQYDFHPFSFVYGIQFDPQNMKPDGGSSKTTETILGCVGMGLKISAAKGPKREPEEILQVRVPIVTKADI